MLARLSHELHPDGHAVRSEAEGYRHAGDVEQGPVAIEYRIAGRFEPDRGFARSAGGEQHVVAGECLGEARATVPG